MKKKLITILLVMAMSISTLTGCDETTANEFSQSAEEILSAIEDIQEFTDSLSANKEPVEEEPLVEEEEIIIESDEVPESARKAVGAIAKLNSLTEDEINIRFNDEGYMTFLGHAYCEDVIKDEDDALLSLEKVSDLVGLEGISLDFYRADVSPISGNTYYTFYQVSEMEINGKNSPIEFYNNMIKVVADSDGNSVALSSYLNHDEIPSYDSEDLLSPDEVNDYVKSIVEEDDVVLGDATRLVYWDDDETASEVSTGKTIPAYIVYVKKGYEDESLEEKLDEIEGHYSAVIIYALKSYTSQDSKEDYEIIEIASYDTRTLDSDMDGEYTSLEYFAQFEPAGEYSYTVSLDWIKSVYEEYEGASEMELTVPVAYNKKDKLYYLIDVDRKILVNNSYDFYNYDMSGINPVVSDNPEDINSWRFLKVEDNDQNIEYMFDANYVLPTYSNMIDVYDFFADRYGFKGVDESGMPIMLGVYAYDEAYPGAYPDKITDFMYNAYCGGQYMDYMVIMTSPELPGCISPVVMTHEFTHGVNGQLTSSQYYNQQGAMMEAFADIIALNMVNDNEYYDEPVWKIGGMYGEVLRDVENPESLMMPNLIYGANYMPETIDKFADFLDNGGVHTNSNAANYLAYRFVNADEELLENEATLSFGDNLDMWFETMYLATYVTDFIDEGHFLTFTSRQAGLSEEKINYVDRLLREYGFLGENDVFRQKLEAQDAVNVVFNIDATDDSVYDRYNIAIRNIYVSDEGYNRSIGIGEGITEDGSVVFKISKAVEQVPQLYVLSKNEDGDDEYESYISLRTYKQAQVFDSVNIFINEVELTTNYRDEFRVPDGERVVNYDGAVNNYSRGLMIDGSTSFDTEGGYIVVTLNDEGDYNIYLIRVCDNQE